MPHHEWGEENFDWKGLNAAGTLIHKYCWKRARLPIHWKEKYGTLRIEFLQSCIISNRSPIHSILYPGHLFIRYPKWMRKIDLIVGKVLTFTGVIGILQKYQLYIFKKAVFNAVKEYPHLKDEILCDTCLEMSDEELEKVYYDS